MFVYLFVCLLCVSCVLGGSRGLPAAVPLRVIQLSGSLRAALPHLQERVGVSCLPLFLFLFLFLFVFCFFGSI